MSIHIFPNYHIKIPFLSCHWFDLLKIWLYIFYDIQWRDEYFVRPIISDMLTHKLHYHLNHKDQNDTATAPVSLQSRNAVMLGFLQGHINKYGVHRNLSRLNIINNRFSDSHNYHTYKKITIEKYGTVPFVRGFRS